MSVPDPSGAARAPQSEKQKCDACGGLVTKLQECCEMKLCRECWGGHQLEDHRNDYF